METNWELIAKHLSGETNKEEENAILQWRKQHIENEQLYQEMYQIWHSKKQESYIFDSQIAFDKLTQRIQKEKPLSISHKNTQVTHKRVFISKGYYQSIVAAVVLSLVAFIAWWWQNNENQKTEKQAVAKIKIKNIKKENPKGQRLQLRLPDGSKVWLNAESKIQYPSEFQGNTREIMLTGEAFFDVTHHPEKPFVIITPHTKVQVLGTSFNVRAFDDEKSIETVVVTGKVKVAESTNEDNFTILNPNEKGEFSLQNKKLKKQTVNPQNYIAWKEGILKFENENMKHIIKELERWYGVTITVTHPTLLNCHLTGDFKNESLESILIFMQKALDIQYEINHKEVKIRGKGCK